MTLVEEALKEKIIIPGLPIKPLRLTFDQQKISYHHKLNTRLSGKKGLMK